MTQEGVIRAPATSSQVVNSPAGIPFQAQRGASQQHFAKLLVWEARRSMPCLVGLAILVCAKGPIPADAW